MAKVKPLVFMPLDLQTLTGSERFVAGQELGSAFSYGIEAYLQTQYGESVRWLRAALQAPSIASGGGSVLTPRERAAIHLYLGNAFAFDDDWASAEREYLHSVEIDPGLAEAYYNLGAASAARGHLDRAIAAFREALDRSEQLYEAHFALGRAYQRLGDMLRAYVHFRSAHEIRPLAGEPHYYMGLMHQSQGAYELAEESFARALQVEDGDPVDDGPFARLSSVRTVETAQWYYRLADDLKDQGFDDEAERVYRRLLDWRPSEHHARYLLGNLMARVKRWEDAVAAYLLIPPDDPHYVMARHRIAAVLRLARRLRQAYTVLWECARERPHEGQTFIQMGKLLYDLERPFAAARALERAAELRADDAFAHYMVGFMYLVIARDHWAIIAWRRAIAIQPETYSLRYDLACVYMRLGQYQRAIDETREVLRHRPDDVAAAFVLALCYKESSDPARAIPLLHHVIQRQPSHAQAVYHLGACYLQVGNAVRGHDYLQQYDQLITVGAGASRLPYEVLPRGMEAEVPALVDL